MRKLLLLLMSVVAGSAIIGQTPSPTPMSKEPAAIEINKKPLTDFAKEVTKRWDAKEIDLNQNFRITLNAVLTKDVTFDVTKSKFDLTKQSGDPKMILIGKAALEALGDSGYLNYLSALGTGSFTAVLGQDDNTFEFVITLPQKEPERKNVFLSALNVMISIVKTKAEKSSDESTILDGLMSRGDGTNIVLQLTLPKTVAQEIFTRKLSQTPKNKNEQK